MEKKSPEIEEIRIYGIPAKLKEDLENIATEMGHNTLTSFLRPELRKIANDYKEKIPKKPDLGD